MVKRFILSLLFMGLATSVIAENDELLASARSARGKSGMRFSERRAVPEAVVRELTDGCLIVNGEHITMPVSVVISPAKGTAKIGNHEVLILPPDNQMELKTQNRYWRETLQTFEDTFECGGTVFAGQNFPPAVLDEYLFSRVILSAENRGEVTKELLTSVEGPTADFFISWIEEFKPSEALKGTARSLLKKYEENEAKTNTQTKALQMLSTFSYPMTLIGMLVGVYTFGHLMMITPCTPHLYRDSQTLTLMAKATLISAALIAAHATLDLSWTVMMSQAGRMREVNPLGAQFVDSPVALISFKLVATLVACALLITLRRHRSAQIACWWMLLVCTILTFRWLMFNSMFA